MTGAVAATAAAGVGFRLVVTPETAFGTRSGSGPVTTNSVTASLVPNATFTVIWENVGGAAIVDSPTSKTTTFSGDAVVGEPIEATFQVTAFVSGQAVDVAAVPVTLGAI